MRKRKKKKIVVDMDEDGYWLNCYGKRILWTKNDLKKAKQKARKIAKLINWNNPTNQ